MTGHDMLKRARELARDHEKHMVQDGTAAMLNDLIAEIERLREAAKGSAVIVNQARSELAELKKEVLCPDCGRHILSEPTPATGWIAKCGRRLTRLDECGQSQTCTDAALPSGQSTHTITFDQFHNAIRVLWNIDRPEWMTAEQWFAFNSDPHRFFVKADDETARKLWAVIEPRLTRSAP